ncbi:MAG: hypothetical protein ACOCTI_03480 [Phycisphaeraceae bacterium]
MSQFESAASVGRRVVAPARGRVALESFPLPLPGEGEVLVRPLFSAVSPGTELAWLDAAAGDGRSMHVRSAAPRVAAASLWLR